MEPSNIFKTKTDLVSFGSGVQNAGKQTSEGEVKRLTGNIGHPVRVTVSSQYHHVVDGVIANMVQDAIPICTIPVPSVDVDFIGAISWLPRTGHI